MITIITVTRIIEAATVTPIMMTTIVTRITITITRRQHRKPEGEAGNHNRWVAYKIYRFFFFFWWSMR